MAFHVACPITCRRICFCTLGFPQKLQSEKGREKFLEEVFRVEEFLTDPCSFRVKESESVQVLVPKIVVPVPVPSKKTIVIDGFGSGDGAGSRDGEGFWLVQKRQASLQNSAVASLAAEDFARKFETGGLVVQPQDVSKERAHYLGEEDEDSSAVKLMCSMCFCGENEGSERAAKMLACKICYKKYHRSCLKSWAQYRDLFHWSSWACPSCRVCEVCRRTGDPNKLMFCKRCDGAYHCYCQQPAHKNVTTGPYLCPKHTKCHSCGSMVPGSGLSTRWFLGYNYCDACGRLFVKGKYCPVCLKVYRDSESTPMVCCDACERWVHCQCDGISDEKYLQFQADNNLYYECNACRGDCYQIKDLDDAVQELWRRRDNADQEQIASLRAAAGLPSQEEIFSISPYSDDEDYDPVMSKTGYGRSLKISVKGLSDKAAKTPKEYGKKSSSKKYKKKKGYKVSSISKAVANENFESLHAVQSIECKLGDERNSDMHSYENERKDIFSSVSPANSRENCTINQAGSMKNSFIGEAMMSSEERGPRVLHIKSSKPHGLDLGEGSGRQGSKSETVKGTKLVIHLGARNRNITSSPISEASSCLREQDLSASNGSEGTSQRKAKDKKYMVEEHDGIVRLGDGKAEPLENPQQFQGSRYVRREGSLIKFGKLKSDEVSEVNPSFGTKGHESLAVEKTHFPLERSSGISTGLVEPITETNTLRNDDVLLRRHSKSTPNIRDESHDKTPSALESLPKDPRPLLKLKFKTPYLQNRNLGVLQGEEDKSSIKGQRSKRKRPSPIMDKSLIREDEGDTQLHSDNPIDEAIDANWILKKLGKDATGKRVEVHQPADGSWHKGVVTDMLEGSSTLAVLLDDGRSNTLDLGRQRVRFVSQKQKRSKTVTEVVQG